MLVREWLDCATLLRLGLMAACSAATVARADGPDLAAFFERQIRPVLAENCYKCHGPVKQQGGLRLDSRSAQLEGGDSGAAIVPGKPEDSLLIAAVRQTDELSMPPKSKLKPEQIAALERWIALGAPWPEAPKSSPETLAETQRRHWAFQPIADPEPPTVIDSTWERTPIDRFILARLEAARLAPAPPADRRTLIRRATYTLTGLPPTTEQVDGFVKDEAPDAFARLIDRLLASPQYGEHWGRHWLDVARYADSKGYVYAREERFFVHAWAYRDWVVRALNEDLAYDRFLLLQIAADQVAPRDRSSLAAMGLLTVGRRFIGVTRDIIDDRIDVVTRGAMALSVGCARCHDHKYDPIPTADYYSLYGVFQSCREETQPIGELPARNHEVEKYEKELAARQKKFTETFALRRGEASTRLRQRVADYLAAQLELSKYPEEGFDIILTKNDLIPASVRRWESFLRESAKEGEPIFAAWHAFAQLPEAELARRAGTVVAQLQKMPATRLHASVARAFRDAPQSRREVADRYGKLFADVDRQWQELQKDAQRRGAAPPTGLADRAAESLRAFLYAEDSPCTIPDEPIVNVEWYFDTGTIEELWKLQGEVDRWIIQSPLSPPHAVYLVDRPKPTNARIFKRGNPANKGDETPRQFLGVLSGSNRQPFTRGSGRLELANAIVHPNNPLTARVLVNRVWMHHFGTGLVRTASDFGLRADPPSHPELLDWLARRFMADSWSQKKLHRLIMLSAAWQQSSAGPVDPALRQRALKVDPDNRLLWRRSLRRLGFEEFRDTLLAVGNDLDLRVGGKPAELLGNAFRRRTIYGLVDRQFLPGVWRVFDFANPDLHIPQRSETTVPQQGLFALNHPFMAERARRVAQRVATAGAPAAQVQQLYGYLYQRPPTERQLAAAVQFLQSAPPAPGAPALDPLAQLAQVLLMTNELVFVD